MNDVRDKMYRNSMEDMPIPCQDEAKGDDHRDAEGEDGSREDEIGPITDENEIKDILDIFAIEP